MGTAVSEFCADALCLFFSYFYFKSHLGSSVKIQIIIIHLQIHPEILVLGKH